MSRTDTPSSSATSVLTTLSTSTPSTVNGARNNTNINRPSKRRRLSTPDDYGYNADRDEMEEDCNDDHHGQKDSDDGNTDETGYDVGYDAGYEAESDDDDEDDDEDRDKDDEEDDEDQGDNGNSGYDDAHDLLVQNKNAQRTALKMRQHRRLARILAPRRPSSPLLALPEDGYDRNDGKEDSRAQKRGREEDEEDEEDEEGASRSRVNVAVNTAAAAAADAAAAAIAAATGLPTPPPEGTPSSPPAPKHGHPLMVDTMESVLPETLTYEQFTPRRDDPYNPRRRGRTGRPPHVRAYGIPTEEYAAIDPAREPHGVIAYPHLFIEYDSMPSKWVQALVPVTPPPSPPLLATRRLTRRARAAAKSASTEVEVTPEPAKRLELVSVPQHSVSVRFNEVAMRGHLSRLHNLCRLAVSRPSALSRRMPEGLNAVYAVVAVRGTEGIKVVRMRREGDDEPRYPTQAVFEADMTPAGLESVGDFLRATVFGREVLDRRIDFVNHWSRVAKDDSERTSSTKSPSRSPLLPTPPTDD